MTGGHAEEVYWPESATELADVLRQCSEKRRPVTVSGAGTGVVGGRVPIGGVVLALERLASIGEPRAESDAARITVQAGAPLETVQRAAAAAGWLYPPDPTETSAAIGGTIATNASGARSFRYGPTRAWVESLSGFLADGTPFELHRGQTVEKAGRLAMPLANGRVLDIPAPDWSMPSTRKHAAGYFSARGMDLIDLLIGSEGTLAVIVEAELRLLPAPEELLTGVLMFTEEWRALEFVVAARGEDSGRSGSRAFVVEPISLELFDGASLDLLRRRGAGVCSSARAAIFFEQPVYGGEDRDAWLAAYAELADRFGALDASWLAGSREEARCIRELRHELPVAINETLARRGVAKLSTDTAVPSGTVNELLAAYREVLDRAEIEHVAFGHVGDDHLHLNLLARDPDHWCEARRVYDRLIGLAVEHGREGSAEQGRGKHKPDARKKR
ncbi:MAG: FAD-binding oxidoreductase [Acidobacteriota bacterium]|nr:MAG: FAD-binding oxidoreductase [Acidobacteriota bacterium]